MNEELYPGCAANVMEEKTVQIVLNETLLKNKKVTNTHMLKQTALEPEDVVMQNHMMPSVHTNLIQCFYFLELEFDHGGLGTNNIPKVILPIFVFPMDVSEDLHQY